MDNHLKQFVREAKEIRLTDAERSRMRSLLVSRMQGSVPSRWSFLLFMRVPHMPMIAALLIVVVLGSGTAAAAENAMPGDVLYPVKVSVTEPARSLVAVTPAAKVAWETQRAERRLSETELLAASGKLDEDTHEKLSARFEVALAKAEAGIETLGEDDAVRVAGELSTALDAHSRILGQVAEVADGKVDTLREKIATRIEVMRGKRDALRLALASREDAHAVGTETLARVDEEAKEAFEEFAEYTPALDADAEVAIGERVREITAAIDEGKANLTLGAYETALADFDRARGLIGVGERLLKAKEKLDGKGVVWKTRQVPAATTMMFSASSSATSATSTAHKSEAAEDAAAEGEVAQPVETDAVQLRIDLGL